MKTAYILIPILGIGLIALYIGLSQYSTHDIASDPEPVACTMDAMECPDGSYVGRVAPSCAFAPCPDTPQPEIEDPRIRIASPYPDTTITSPVTVSGEARGNWFFEGSAPVTVVDWDGKIIGEGFVTAEGEWMTTDFVPFSGTISYTIDPNTPYNRGTIIFQKDNPSGLPEFDDAREVPVTFSELMMPGTGATDPGLGEGESVFCTMDAMECPDGSYVGRVPPSCAFAPCSGAPAVQ